MSNNKFLCTSLLIVAILAAQGFSEGRPTPVAEILKERNIALDIPSLLQALQNSDADIRGLAALQLAGEKVILASPAIEEALAKETITRTRVDMAVALTWLADKKGTEVLKDTCANSQIPTAFRTMAASYLLDANDESCLDAVLGILESSPDERQVALSLLPKFKNVSEDQSRKIYTSTIKSLTDASPAVRLTASHTCVALANAAAIPELQRAIAYEENKDVRREMENALGRLQERVKH